VSCLGQCDYARTCGVNDHVYRNMSEADCGRGSRPPGSEAAAHQHADHSLGWRIDIYNGNALRRGSQAPGPRRVGSSRRWRWGLRGMGGAGSDFRSGRPSRRQSDDKYIVCNATRANRAPSGRELLRAHSLF